MRRTLVALAIAGLLALPVSQASADEPDRCTGYAASAAFPSLMQSYQFSPQGYGGLGYAPLTYPFGTGPYGVGTFFGGPGVPYGTVPAFGPIGPGFTSVNLANNVLIPQTGYSPYNAAVATSTTIPLLGLQQGELANLNVRYSNSAYYQTASATWAGAYATQASTAFTILQALCNNPPPVTTMASPMMSPTMSPMMGPSMGSMMYPGMGSMMAPAPMAPMVPATTTSNGNGGS